MSFHAMPMRKSISTLISVVIIGLLLFILEHLEPPANTFLWRELFNIGHVPLFGVLSLLFLNLSINILGRFLSPYYWHYLVALAVATATGVASEFIQIFGSRDADIGDLTRDLVGAVVFLGLTATFDLKIKTPLKQNISRHIPAFRIFLLLLFISTFVPVFLWFGAYWHRDRIFPTLFNFDSSRQKAFIQTHHARLSFVPPPPEWPEISNGKIARITYTPATWPDLEMNEPYPDWSGYDSLVFSILSTVDTTARMSIRIEDIHHNHHLGDRYTLSFYVEKGLNRISLPLSDVASAPASRKMDMTAIHAMHLYVYKIPDSLIFYVDKFFLK